MSKLTEFPNKVADAGTSSSMEAKQRLAASPPSISSHTGPVGSPVCTRPSRSPGTQSAEGVREREGVREGGRKPKGLSARLGALIPDALLTGSCGGLPLLGVSASTAAASSGAPALAPRTLSTSALASPLAASAAGASAVSAVASAAASSAASAEAMAATSKPSTLRCSAGILSTISGAEGRSFGKRAMQSRTSDRRSSEKRGSNFTSCSDGSPSSCST
mmetsp:Transcript_167621/g.538342  ORF Transcript_167621/g.538342 Transcript_167621/m.538342 type:complete len:219 (+) Transcript_167621:833-1489(+)